MKKNRKVKIEILALLFIFCFTLISPFFLHIPVKASSPVSIPYVFTNYEYNQVIDSMGYSENVDYNLSSIRPRYVDLSILFGNNYDYKSKAMDFCTFLSTDLNSQNLTLYDYKIIAFYYYNYKLHVKVCSSEKPLYMCGNTIYSFEQNSLNSFNRSYYQLEYNYDSDFEVFSLNRIEQTNLNYLSNSIVSADGTTQIYSLTSNDFRENLAYSDAIIRAQYDSSGSGVQYINFSSYGEGARTYYDNELSNYNGNTVCVLDRRTLFPDFVDSLLSEDERYINEHSRCGLKNYSFYVGGNVTDNVKNIFQYELNDYTKQNKSHCKIRFKYDFVVGGNYEGLKINIQNSLQNSYGSPSIFHIIDNEATGGVLIDSSYTGQYSAGTLYVDVPLDDASEFVNTYEGSISVYFSQMVADSIYINNNGETQHPRLDRFITALIDSYGYTYSSGGGIGGSTGISILKLNWNSSNTNGSATSINYMNFISHVQIIDENDSSKNSFNANMVYHAFTGSTDTDGSIVYDDSDMYDKRDDPDYTVPTQPTTSDSPTVTTQTVITTGGGGTVTVTNSNVNNNNPEIHVTPTINVTAGGGSSDDDDDTREVINITDDDSVDEEDVQGLLDKIENFLDFDDTFYDEYISTILSVIPAEVWEPFAISSAFVAIGSMIAFVLRR